MTVRAATVVPSTLLQPEPPGGSGGEMAPFMAQALYTLPEAMSQANEAIVLGHMITMGLMASQQLSNVSSFWRHTSRWVFIRIPKKSSGFIRKSFHHRSSFRLMISEFSADLPFSFGGPTFETSNIWSKTWSKGLVKPPSSLVPPLLVRTRGKGQAVLQRGRCLLRLESTFFSHHGNFQSKYLVPPNLQQSDATSHTELIHFCGYVLLCSTYVYTYSITVNLHLKSLVLKMVDLKPPSKVWGHWRLIPLLNACENTNSDVLVLLVLKQWKAIASQSTPSLNQTFKQIWCLVLRRTQGA